MFCKNIADRQKLNKYLFYLLCGIIAFHILCVCLWINRQPLPQGKAVNQHFRNVYYLIQSITSSGDFRLDDFRRYVFSYPPFYYLVATVLKMTLGFICPRVILLTSSIFFVVLVLSVYYASEKMCFNSGFISATILSSYPAVYPGLYQFNLEIASVAMVTLVFCMLLFSRAFVNRKFSLLFGVCLGLLMLTRQFLVAFLLAPLMCVIVEVIKIPNRKAKKNLFIAGILAVIIAVLYYGYRSAIVYSFSAVTKIAVFESLNFFQFVKWFVCFVIKEGTGLFLGYVAIIAFFLSLMLRFTGKRYVYLWMFCPFIFIPMILVLIRQINNLLQIYHIHQGQMRFYFLQGSYILPVLPSLALISGITLAKIPHRLIKLLTIGGILVIAMISCYNSRIMKLTRMPARVFQLNHGMYSEFESPTQARQLFRYFDDRKKKIGILSFGTEPALVSLYTRIISLSLLRSNNNPQIINFFSSPGAFLSRLHTMKYLIIADCVRHNSWPEKAYIDQQIEEFFNVTGFPSPFKRNSTGEIFLPGYELENFQKLQNNFIFQETLTYYILPNNVPVFLTVYVNQAISES